MSVYTDPQTGLPMDEQGNILDAQAAGSDQVLGPQAAFDKANPAGVADIQDPNPTDGSAVEMNPPDTGTLADPFSDHAMISAIDQVPAPGEKHGSGSKVDITFNGYTPAGKKYAADTFGQAQKAADVKKAELYAQYDQHKAALDAGYATQRDALNIMSDVDKRHHEALLDIHRQQGEFMQAQAHLEQMAAVKAQATGQQYLAAYQTDMAGVRQLMMQTGNPLGGLDTSGGMALAGAAFAQGFLAARGTNINVTGQVDKWVDREMAHHQQMIANRTNLAQSNLTLYGIAREGAQDEWEARQRVRGFVIDGLKMQLQMEADKYGSASAAADAKAKIGQLDVLQASTMIGLQEKVTKQVHENEQLAITKAAAQAHASAEYAKIAVEQKRNDELKREFDAKNKPAPALDPNLGLVSDVTDVQRDPATGKVISGGKFKWKVDYAGQPDAVVKHTIETVGKIKGDYAAFAEELDKLRVLRAKAMADVSKYPDGVLGVDVRSRASEPYRMYKQQKELIVQKIQKIQSGTASSDQEAERKANLVADDKLLMSGDNSKFIDSLQEDLRTNANNQYRAMEHIGLIPLSEAEQRYDAVSPQLDPGGKARDAANLTSDGPVTSPVETDVKTVLGGVGKFGADTNQPTEFFSTATLKEPTRAWTELMPAQTPQPELSKRVEEMALGVISPATYREAHKGEEGMLDGNDALRKQLQSALVEIGQNEKVGADVQGFAKMLLLNIAQDPHATRRMLEHGVGVTIEGQ